MKDFLFPNNSVLVLYTKKNKAINLVNLPKVSNMLVNYFFKNTDVLLTRDELGRPLINKGHLNISISHSKEITVCAISPIPIGIDIEFKRNISEKCYSFANTLYSKYFSIETLEDWVRLESLVKLKELRLDNLYSSNITIEHVKCHKVNISNEYICRISSEHKIKKIKLKKIKYYKIVDYAKC